MRGTETAIVHPSTGKDRNGVDTWGPNRTVEGVIPWPRTSAELDDGGTHIGENVLFPPGSVVKNGDNVTLRGVRYAVDGRPGDLRLRGRKRGLLVLLKGVS